MTTNLSFLKHSLHVSFVLAILLLDHHPSHALIVSPRPSTEQSYSHIGERTRDRFSSFQQQQQQSVVRIRTTRRADVDQVADILSSAISGPSDGSSNFKERMERLRVKSSIMTTLGLRVRAVEEGKKYLSQSVLLGNQQHQDDAIITDDNNTDHLRYLWSQDSFRNKIEAAAELSSEPHPWEHHNFVLAPEDPCWLRHEMITAECTQTGTIAGFCEIAMLLCPPLAPPSQFERNDNDSMDFEEEYCTIECAPTIANLVVSSDWRRRGIAKGLIKSAERLVERKWKSTELGLYVEKSNQRALQLYLEAGYEVKSSLNEPKSSDKWYMSKPFGS